MMVADKSAVVVGGVFAAMEHRVGAQAAVRVTDCLKNAIVVYAVLSQAHHFNVLI
jgi:hypothetical protein